MAADSNPSEGSFPIALQGTPMQHGMIHAKETSTWWCSAFPVRSGYMIYNNDEA